MLGNLLKLLPIKLKICLNPKHSEEIVLINKEISTQLLGRIDTKSLLFFQLLENFYETNTFLPVINNFLE